MRKDKSMDASNSRAYNRGNTFNSMDATKSWTRARAWAQLTGRTEKTSGYKFLKL